MQSTWYPVFHNAMYCIMCTCTHGIIGRTSDRCAQPSTTTSQLQYKYVASRSSRNHDITWYPPLLLITHISSRPSGININCGYARTRTLLPTIKNIKSVDPIVDFESNRGWIVNFQNKKKKTAERAFAAVLGWVRATSTRDGDGSLFANKKSEASTYTYTCTVVAGREKRLWRCLLRCDPRFTVSFDDKYNALSIEISTTKRRQQEEHKKNKTKNRMSKKTLKV